MNVNPNDETLRAYMERVAANVGQQPVWNEQLGCWQVATESWGALAVKMHHYFFVTRDDGANAADFDAYVKACVSWGLDNYRGLPRGLQKGVAIYPVLLQTQAWDENVAYTKQKPDAHWAAFVLPTVVNLSAGAIECMEKTPVWGYAMWKGVRKAAQNALG